MTFSAVEENTATVGIGIPSPRGEGVLSPAAGGNGDELRFYLAFETPLRASVTADGQSVRFADEQGAAQFSFSKLVVVDANGKVIPARMEILAEEPELASKERQENNHGLHGLHGWNTERNEDLLKLYYLGLDRIAKKWTMPIANWSEALNRFAIEFGDRMPRLD